MILKNHVQKHLSPEEVKKSLLTRGNVSIYTAAEEYLVLLKSAGIPSAPLAGGKYSALEAVSDVYPEILSVTGRNAAEGGLIHRIDEETAGLLLVARTQNFYDMAQMAQKAGLFVKTYTAYCEHADSKTKGQPSAAFPYTIESRFRPLGERGAKVKPVFEGEASRADLKKAGAAVYRTTVLELEPFNPSVDKKNECQASKSALGSPASKIIRARCAISAGFRHQVRAHLSAIGYPVIGDKLYGSMREDSGCDISEKADEPAQMLFFASGLEIKDADLSVNLPEEVLDEIADTSVCS